MAEKNWLDKVFDVADTVMGGIESTLKPDTGPTGVIDAEFRTVPDKFQWETKSWAACTDDRGHTTHHVMSENVLVTICDETYQSHQVSRLVLEHGKRIVACTSCIIKVAHG